MSSFRVEGAVEILEEILYGTPPANGEIAFSKDTWMVER